jgi:hypothetical protein
MSSRKSIFLFLSFLVAGCSAYGPEELERLVKEDPQFAQMIAARDQANAQIRVIKNDLLAKKKAMDAQISKLRGEYDAYAKEQNLKIEKYQTAIEANRFLLKKEIDAINQQLEVKLTELSGYQKTLSDVKKVMRESKGIQLSKAEQQKWEERVLMLSEKIRPLSEEIQELKFKIRLKKQKISFLK